MFSLYCFLSCFVCFVHFLAHCCVKLIACLSVWDSNVRTHYTLTSLSLSLCNPHILLSFSLSHCDAIVWKSFIENTNTSSSAWHSSAASLSRWRSVSRRWPSRRAARTRVVHIERVGGWHARQETRRMRTNFHFTDLSLRFTSLRSFRVVHCIPFSEWPKTSVAKLRWTGSGKSDTPPSLSPSVCVVCYYLSANSILFVFFVSEREKHNSPFISFKLEANFSSLESCSVSMWTKKFCLISTFLLSTTFQSIQVLNCILL